jgi:multiple sugar transport system permease protein
MTTDTNNMPNLSLAKIRRRSPASMIIGQVLIWLFVVIMVVIEIAPVSWLFSTSLRDPARSFDLPPDFLPTDFKWENYLAVINSTDIDFLRFFSNSLKIAVIVTAAQLLTCSMAAFSFARLRYPGRNTFFFLFLGTMMIPGTVIIIPTFILMRSLDLIDTHWALILPALTSAFGVFLLRQQFLTLPEELMEAARMDGAGFFRIFWQVALPLIGPGLSALAIFTFLGSWNNFFGPLLYLRSWEKFTYPIAIVNLQGYMGMGNRAHVLAAVMIGIFPVLALFLVAQRYVIQGIAVTGLKG